MAKRGKRSSKKSKTPAAPPAPTVQSSDPLVQPYLGALNKLAGDDKAVGSGLAGGAELGSLLYGPGSMGRVDETMSPEAGSILWRMRQEADLGGNQQSQEVTDALRLQQQAAEGSSLNNPNVQAAIQALRGASDASAVTNPTIAAAIERAQRLASDAGTLDPRLTEILDLRKNALGGLNTAEMTAAREDAQVGLNRSLSTAMRNMNIARGGSGPRGNASMIGAIPLTAQYAQAQQGLERQLLLDNYEKKQQALGLYSQDSQDILNQQMANRLSTNQNEAQVIGGFNQGAVNAAGALAGGVNTLNQGAASAAQGFANTANNVMQFNIQDRMARFNNYVNYFSNLKNDLYKRQLENLNRLGAEKSGFLTTTLGGGAFAAEQEGRSQSFDLAKENLDFQKKVFGSGGGGGSSSGGESSSQGFGSGGDSFA